MTDQAAGCGSSPAEPSRCRRKAPAPAPPFPFPSAPPDEPERPKPPPSIGARWAGIGVARARAGVVAELAALRGRVAELEHANRRLAGDVERARADGERASGNATCARWETGCRAS